LSFCEVTGRNMNESRENIVIAAIATINRRVLI
jgi:hypothetical protein